VESEGIYHIVHFVDRTTGYTEQTVTIAVHPNGDVELSDVYIPESLRGQGLLTTALQAMRVTPGLSGRLRVSVGMNQAGWRTIISRAGFELIGPLKSLGHAILLKEVRARELWPQYLARLKGNDCHNPAGSPDGGQFCGDGGSEGAGSVFGSAPVTSLGAAAWRKSTQTQYDSDPGFKATADAITQFTQGDYTVIRGLAEHELTGEWNKDLRGTRWETALDEKMSGMPGYDYKNFYKGQDVKAGGEATWRDGVHALVNAIDSASPLDKPMYRGLNGYENQAQVLALKPGDDFTVVAPTSFTADRNLAVKWSQGKVSGQGGGSFSGPTIIIEVQSGAKGLKVAALSPFKQSEILSSGTFKVVRVESGLDESRLHEQTRLVLQQHSTRRISR
jgi:hypothetical protein